LHLAKDNSEMGLPIENEVIEELSEHDEDERRTQEKFFKKTG